MSTRGLDSSRKNAPATRQRRATPLLTTAERRKLVKAVQNYEEVIESVVRTWSELGSAFRVMDRTPGQLNRLLKRARRAVEREQNLRAKVEPKLSALMDARLLAVNDAWKAVLDVYRQVQAVPDAEEIQQRFGFLSEVFARPKRSRQTRSPVSEKQS